MRTQDVYEVMEMMCPFLKIYSSYATNYAKAQDSLLVSFAIFEWGKRSIKFPHFKIFLAQEKII